VVCPATRRLRRPTQSIRYRTGTAGWTRPRRWLDQAAAAGVLGRAQKGAALAAVTQAAALVETALAAGPGFLLAHRDASARNILITDRGPVLLDYAGPEVPWWEFVHHCFDLASPSLGRQPPRPDMVRAALTAGRRAIVLVPEATPLPATAVAVADAFGERVGLFLGGGRRARGRAGVGRGPREPPAAEEPLFFGEPIQVLRGGRSGLVNRQRGRYVLARIYCGRLNHTP